MFLIQTFTSNFFWTFFLKKLHTRNCEATWTRKMKGNQKWKVFTLPSHSSFSTSFSVTSNPIAFVASLIPSWVFSKRKTNWKCYEKPWDFLIRHEEEIIYAFRDFRLWWICYATFKSEKSYKKCSLRPRSYKFCSKRLRSYFFAKLAR